MEPLQPKRTVAERSKRVFNVVAREREALNAGNARGRRPVDTALVFSAQQQGQTVPDRIFPLEYVSAHFSRRLLSHAASVGVKSGHPHPDGCCAAITVEFRRRGSPRERSSPRDQVLSSVRPVKETLQQPVKV